MMCIADDTKWLFFRIVPDITSFIFVYQRDNYIA